MRRPGPRGQKQLKESFGSSSVQALLEVTSVVRGERDLKSALATIVQTVAEALEFKTVVLNLYRPEFDDFYVETVHGDADVREALLGSVYDWDSWTPLLDEQFMRAGAYFIANDAFDWSKDRGERFVPAWNTWASIRRTCCVTRSLTCSRDGWPPGRWEKDWPTSSPAGLAICRSRCGGAMPCKMPASG